MTVCKCKQNTIMGPITMMVDSSCYKTVSACSLTSVLCTNCWVVSSFTLKISKKGSDLLKKSCTEEERCNELQ